MQFLSETWTFLKTKNIFFQNLTESIPFMFVAVLQTQRRFSLSFCFLHNLHRYIHYKMTETRENVQFF